MEAINSPRCLYVCRMRRSCDTFEITSSFTGEYMVQPQAVLNVLFKYEQDTSLVDRKLLYEVVDTVVESGTLTCVLFSCLATVRGKEELVMDFFKTLFFEGGSKEISNATKRAVRLVQEVEGLGLNVNVIPILVDTEPRRTWGWQTPQDDLTLTCELMIEQARESGLLPPNWIPVLWSSLEARYRRPWTFDLCLDQTKWSKGKQLLYVHEQEEHLAKFSDRYHFPLGLHETAIRQVAAYAFEGVVLEEVLPDAILLQSEYPWADKDPLYQWLRDKRKPLQIVHPFPK